MKCPYCGAESPKKICARCHAEIPEPIKGKPAGEKAAKADETGKMPEAKAEGENNKDKGGK